MTAGLRRFVLAQPAGVDGQRPVPAQAARCELCAEPLLGDHGHLVDLGDRTIACACRACYLLFTVDGAGGGSYRAVPERYRYTPRLPITDAVWDRLGVPVGLAFFFYNSALEQPVGLYPSPAGATESPLAVAAWQELVQASPVLADLAPDVEALLVNRVAPADAAVHFEGFAVPIDACYRLVGLVRMHWRGFDGGQEAWQAIGELLAELRARGEPSGGAGRG